MIEVVTSGRMVLIGRDGEEPKPYSPKFGLTTTEDGQLCLTGDSDGTQFIEVFTQWTVDGKAYPELPTQAAVAAAIDKAARR